MIIETVVSKYKFNKIDKIKFNKKLFLQHKYNKNVQ